MHNPTTKREASRKDHLPYEARHLDDIEWETIRWPGETGKMLFHPRPERPTEPNAGILRLAIVQYPGPTTQETPIYAGRFNMNERKSVAEERVDL